MSLDNTAKLLRQISALENVNRLQHEEILDIGAVLIGHQVALEELVSSVEEYLDLSTNETRANLADSLDYAKSVIDTTE